ncbi:MAG: hypothetical protein A2W98_14680 [Bacteroidetes bacterium GWF2_33_38]|nr:MAG: hypothetical protein A2W98_14680 [Bacteroidetes bacterium GWF2_33_38]OFY92084.1 MAG: hypothetical protein A2236_07710 [Bacteroidetes bacterium RIFOXYA2_FULL_33_7]
MKTFLVFSLFLSFSIISFSQTLNLPERSIGAKSGSEIVAYINSMSLTDRENAIYSEVISGNVPDFMRNMVQITDVQTINTQTYTIFYFVIPDYLALGNDSDYFLCPMTPLLAQRIANYTDCSLTTRKMVDDIWSAASVKLSPSPISPSAEMVTVPVFSQHNTTVWGQRSAVLTSHPLGELVAGDKKDVVISTMIYGYPSPGRVVIYGWHQSNGVPIQQLYNGHEETYADYSHGIRLVQNTVYVNDSISSVQEILSSPTYHVLLSDEGVISIPTYPVVVPEPQKPTSFCVLQDTDSSLIINISHNSDNEGYVAQYGIDGINFPNTISSISNNFTISDLASNIAYYVKTASYIDNDTSEWSEVLAATTLENSTTILIVNGFDRATTGNTYNFIRQHGEAILANFYGFSSATNEAIISGLAELSNYNIVDYILGEESSVNETFSNTEQSILADFLDNGGKLFVSGAEIAWDLDHLGSASDKSFFNNYLKSSYVYDAPNNVSANYYQISPISSSFFSDISTFYIDNGTQGTYNVKYPDIVIALNGAEEIMEFSGLTDNPTAVAFSGLFPNGTQEGKLVYFGFPFETVYPESTRFEIMAKTLSYFEYSVYTQDIEASCKVQVFPNPNTGEFFVKYENIENELLEILDISGRVIFSSANIINEELIRFTDFSKGVYFLNIISKDAKITRKIIVQ